jgi:hypothetical protein
LSVGKIRNSAANTKNGKTPSQRMAASVHHGT